MKLKTSDFIFNIILYTLMACVVIITLYPLWYIVVASFSNAVDVTTGNVTVWFKGFNIDSYARVFAMKNIGTSYLNTIFYTVVGTLTSMVLTVFGSYALSKDYLMGRRVIMFLISFTMWFNAGIMPTFLTYQTLGLVDTRMSIIMCGAISTFYVIIMRTYFESIPKSLEESAKLDGAGELRILVSVYIPLAIPALMTIALYYMVMRWNGYFWAMLLLKDDRKIPLQVVLKKLIVTMSGLYDNSDTNADITRMSAQTVVYATIVIAAAPMLFVYPFIQKFFVKGVIVGAVKG